MNRKKELLLKINGGSVSEILYAAHETGLIEALREEKPYEMLPAKRLLGALRILKIIEIKEDKAKLTEEGRLLLQDHPESMLPLLKFKSAPFMRSAWSQLGKALTLGVCPFTLAHGASLFTYLKEHPDALKIFHEGMSFFVSESSSSLLDFVDLSAYKSAVDIGGSLGTFALLLKKRAPHLNTVLFDRPEVIELTKNLPEIEKVSGDFFKAVPKADLYILRNILHDWSEEKAKEILRVVRKEEGDLLIIETCKAETPKESLGQISDLSLLVTTGEGFERTKEEWLSLFHSERLTLKSLIQTGSSKSLFLLKGETV